MNRIKFLSILSLFLFISIIVLNCDKDDPTGPSKSKFFIYGLLGSTPSWSNADSSNYWVYARVFNHPDHNNVEAELEHNSTKIPLEGDYWDGDKYFTEGRLDFSFNPGDVYAIIFPDN